MRRTRRASRTAIAASLAAASLIIASTAALADLVRTGGDVEAEPGHTGTASFFLAPNDPADPVPGCNAGAGNTVRINVTSNSAHVTVDAPGFVTVDDCGEGNAKSIGFTVSGGAPVGHVATITGTAPNGTSGAPNGRVHTTGGPSGVTHFPTYQPDSFTVTIVAPQVANTAPQVAFTDGPIQVDESSTAERVYMFSITDPDDDTWTFAAGSPSCGADGDLVTAGANAPSIDQDAQTGSFACIFDDGPASSTVSVQVSDGTVDSNTATRDVTVENVPPTATLTRVGPANVFVGATVTFNGGATDPSSADTAAGFDWSFDSGDTWGSSSTLARTYGSCGAKVESVLARDKDGGVSDPATASVNVFDGGFHGAIRPAVRNMVQAGRVVPVQIRISCDGVDVTDLAPSIRLFRGDFDPGTDPASEAEVVATSVSAADTTGVMRSVDGGYIYNLLIPSNAKRGDYFTVRVHPWSGDGAMLNAVLEIRR